MSFSEKPDSSSGRCSFDGKCFNFGCKLSHTVQKCTNAAACVDFYCAQRHPRERPLPCKFRSNCKNSAKNPCKCLHPTPLSSSKNPNPSSGAFERNGRSSEPKKAPSAEQSVFPHLQYDKEKALTLISEKICDLQDKLDDLNNQVFSEHVKLEMEALEALLVQAKAQYDSTHTSFVRNTDLARISMRNQTSEQDESHRRVLANRIKRDIFRATHLLPSLSKRLEIEQVLRDTTKPFLIVKGHTGSGKSTQLPQYIADMEEFNGMKIICTQPRKLAATLLASRVAYEFSADNTAGKSDVGEQVGFHVGSSKNIRPYTKIKFMTEGTLISQLSAFTSGNKQNQFDPLAEVGVVIVDEAHERNVNTDVLIGILSRSLPLYPRLKVIITSASMDSKIQLFLEKAKIGYTFIEIPGKTYPVDIIYRPLSDSLDTLAVVTSLVQAAIDVAKNPANVGDILCFVTGQDEAEKAKKLFTASFTAKNNNNAIAMCLYGKQPPDEQKLVFEKQNQRKVIFATDVAETSITIDGVCFVIDSGLTKQNIFDAQKNIMTLKVVPISKSSAEQRKGRAGRTAPGTCIRLYSQDEHELMIEGVIPEIFRKPLELTVATLIKMNLNPVTFPWIEAPSLSSITTAIETLKLFGAVKEDSNLLEVVDNNHPQHKNLGAHLTQLGELVVELQLSTGICKMLLHACKTGYGQCAAILAGLMNVSSMILWRGGDQKTKEEADKKHEVFSISDGKVNAGDIVSYYRIYEKWLSLKSSKSTKQLDDDENQEAAYTQAIQSISASSWCMQNSINNKALGMAFSLSLELEKACKNNGIWNLSESQNRQEVSNSDIQALCLQAQFNNIAFLVKPNTFQYKSYQLGGSKEDFVLGLIHPGSYITDSQQPPKFIIYQSILKTTKTWFIGVTPVHEISSLMQVCSPFYEK